MHREVREAPIFGSTSVGPFDDPDVVAANGAPLAGRSPVGLLVDALGRLEDITLQHMHGRLSAFTADAWAAVGPFDDSVDQTNVVAVRREEEFDFCRRLAGLGTVAYAPEAAAHNDVRRVECLIERTSRLGRSQSPYCSRIGTETFGPPRKR